MQLTFTLLAKIVTVSYNFLQFKCLFFHNLNFSKKEFRSVVILFLCMIMSLAGNAQNSSARVSLPPEPFSIAIQPFNSTVCSGNAATFSVGLPSGGSAYDFQWQVDKGSGVFVNVSDIAPYSGATTKDLTVTATAEMSGYKYQVYVERNGMDDTSDPATLTVHPTPTISIQPVNSKICTDGAAIFSVTSHNATSYQWQENQGSGFNNLSDAGVYSSTTTLNLIISKATQEMSAFTYRCIVSNACAPSVTSAIVAIDFFPSPVIGIQPVTSSVSNGSNASFSATVYHSIYYQWQVNIGFGFNDIINAAPYSASTTSTLIITGTTTLMNGYQYRVIATNGCGVSATSNAVALAVQPAANVTITTQPLSSSVCEGASSSFSVVASNAAAYQWQIYNGSNFVNINSSSPYSGTTSAVLVISAATASMNSYQYRVIVSGFAGALATSQLALDHAPLRLAAPSLPGSVSISSTVVLTVQTTGQWLGTVNSDWNNAGNWTCGAIPTEITNVVIGTASNMPEIHTNAVCKDLTININATLSVLNGEFSIKGAVTNNGSFTANAPVIFSGDAQVIPAGEYSEIQIQGTGTKTLAGNIKIKGLLLLFSSYLQLGNYELLIETGGNILEQSENSFVITNGIGKLRWNGLGAGGNTSSVTFPVGTSSSSYTPFLFKNTGILDLFSVGLSEGISSSYDAVNNPTGTPLTQHNVNKTWLISEGTQGGSTATLTFQWNESDEQTGFLRDNCFVSHYYNGKWNAAASGEAQENGLFSTSLTGVTSFSPFGVGSIGSALPVKLLAFTASPNAENVALDWQTAFELNTVGFDIEAAADAVHFSKISDVASFNQNTAQRSVYHYKASYIKTAAVSYYRLKMLDQDGSFSYSKIVSARNPEVSNNYNIFPNPVQNEQLMVKSTTVQAVPVDITVYDTVGRLLYQTRVDAKVLGQQPVQIPMKGLTRRSNYILKITETDTGTSQRFQFFKE